MTNLTEYTLIAHVLLGITGVIGSYAAWMNLAGGHPKQDWLKKMSWVAFLSYLTSWMIGGYYYVTYYGGNVKPGIKAGEYPWAHSVFTEGKEHVFLFLSFLAVVLLIGVTRETLNLKGSSKDKKALTWLAAVTTAIGFLITISGFIISGSVRV